MYKKYYDYHEQEDEKESYPVESIGDYFRKSSDTITEKIIKSCNKIIKSLEEKDEEISELRTEIKKLEKGLQAVIERFSKDSKDKIYI